uniref:Protein kinase domain-containing protein n=1 Tax=Manihot esculenta TaxID=3983 RepID=A0A2C9VC24_MANES
MEKRRYSPQFTFKIIALLFLLNICCHPIIVQCQASGSKMTRHLSAETPSPSRPHHFNTSLKRTLLSIVLGVLTGLTGFTFCAYVVRCLVRYMNRTPILKGPVIFSPKIAPKTLQSALASENQLLGSSSNGKFPLVYDYLPNESLEDAMNRQRENQLQIGWEVRLRIAVGVVKGLRYLHFECVPQILHYNLKPTNVMLDDEFEPKLADCGLAKLTPNLDRATSGYSAPECFQNCRKDPTDLCFGEAASGGSLGRWLQHLQQAGEAGEALDKSILRGEGEEDEILMAVRIAVVCLSDLPADRPSSDELVLMLSQLHSF